MNIYDLCPVRSLLYLPLTTKHFMITTITIVTVEKRIGKSSSFDLISVQPIPLASLLLQYRHLFMHIFRSCTTSHNCKYEILTKDTSITKTGTLN